MERKIGETFEFEGKKLEVKAASRACDGCFLEEKCCIDSAELLGTCGFRDRTDKKDVIFVEVQEQRQEQAEQQDEQPQKLNLCEVLKYCPQGETFWSPMLGDVALYGIDNEKKRVYILLKTDNDIQMYINADATLTLGDVTSPEIMLYPSREQRDWTKVKYEPKKERFDPKTLKAFDKIIFKGHGMWFCGLFSHIHNSYACVGETYYKCVIPYNDDTKHLVGTRDEAPEFYKYWED